MVFYYALCLFLLFFYTSPITVLPGSLTKKSMLTKKKNTGILSITLLEGQDVFAYANSESGVTFQKNSLTIYEKKIHHKN